MHRNFPDKELHVLVRESFASALDGLDVPLKVHQLSTQHLLGPLIEVQDLGAAQLRVDEFMEELRLQSFDEIINLSFSPLSSYLVDELKSANTLVRGYDRQSDGFLSIPDDSSAYFYAQVGPGQSNRFHLGEIFASVCGVDLIDEDWRAPALHSETLNKFSLPARYVVMHPFSSEVCKTYSAVRWQRTLEHILEETDLNFVIIGSAKERSSEFEIYPQDRVVNLVGQTKTCELFDIIGSAQALLSGDSLGLHMASICKIPTFNLSYSSVNFWETGPRAPGSRVFWAVTPQNMEPEEVSRNFLLWLEGLP
ncbi:MAG: glycosyltransferase family 9 protein, partial [Bdellovibrionales bacterium]|nr:glycosyltransferase family 9 protein [Bdellovibrionales bacterium]